MITHEEIQKLAQLARIEVTGAEILEYAKDFEGILGYVDQINQFPIAEITPTEIQENRARVDAVTHPAGTYHEVLLSNAPDADAGYYKVPKIL